MDELVTVRVCFVNGSDYSYTVKDLTTAKRYAYSIITQGFRIRQEGKYTYYPVHAIREVQVIGGGGQELLVEKKQ
jgi:hypothetical protein